MDENMILGSILVDKNGTRVEIADEKARAAIDELKKSGTQVKAWLRGTTQTVTPAQVIEALNNDRDVAVEVETTEFGKIVFTNFTSVMNGAMIVASETATMYMDGQDNAVTGLVALMGAVNTGEWTHYFTQLATWEYLLEAGRQLESHDMSIAELKSDVKTLNEEMAELSANGPADLTEEQKIQWQANLGIAGEKQVTLTASTLVNGVPGNPGNAQCVSTGAFNISEAKKIRIHTNRPVNSGCIYTVGYVFAETASTFGDGFDFYQAQGYISRLHAHQGTLTVSTMIDVPENAGYARFTMTMYNEETGEYVPLRVTDFAGYSIFITYDVAQAEDERKTIADKNPDAVSNLYAAARYGYNNNGVENSNKRFVMLATTDVHAYEDRLKAAVEFVNEVPCMDCGVTLGDIASEHYSDTDGTWYSEIISESNVPWLTVIGNHDMGNSVSVGESATQAQAYAKWIAPNLGIAGVTSDSSYYCKDFATYNLRLIVLNVYDAPDTLDGNGNFVVSRKVQCISQAQVNWLVSTLAATPAGYTVAVLTHSNPGKGVKDANVHFNHATRKFADEDTQGTLIPEIVNAWVNGTSLSKSFTSTNSDVPTVTVSADFTNRGNGAFAGYILGHTHRDLVGHVDGYEGQKLYGFSATAVGNWQNGEDELPRVTGHRSIDAITAVCIDTDARKVYLVRIGSDISFDLNRRDPVAISY